MASPIYDPKTRYPVQKEYGLCRGCHQTLPKGRRSWCSDKCYGTFEPSQVRWKCKIRDKEICSECGVDTKRLKLRMANALTPEGVNQYSYFNDGQFMRELFDKACRIYRKHLPKIRAASKKRVDSMRAAGWPSIHRSWWEMDHITPFSEGGLTVIENVRTLCVICHKNRTKKWHATRKSNPATETKLLL